VSGLAADAGLPAERVADPGTHPWLTAMFDYYDKHGLPAGTRVLAALLGRL
jgi:NAD(P)H dehydrogenase (quinone)